ncbi:hypothetical protein DLJ53_31945 [Acuticoccus sediminis]|uniref:Polysaccharide pyruvyl transferase domain-containing protein n=1 Tax=Acuticoccus sediminis TaxID=2184697 RepID=A0A8B2NHW9_9HYPH|nr:polysaccharide pyruvyl transferase family protein [Acuticoccus sediminis]RAH96527.1 hypothetical protein DLJ53_31945 [Acuticoccus sediminis]
MSEPLAFMGTPGFVRDPSRFDTPGLLAALGANSGNLMFQYAAAQLLAGPQRHIGRSEIPYTDPAALRGAKYVVVPAANHLRLGADWTGFSNFLERARRPLVVLGLGAQSPRLGGERGTIEALKADPQVSRLAGVIRERAAFVSVRGAFSQTVCAEFGIDNVEVLGCPSALLNPDPEAGAAMAAKLEAARASPEVPLFGLTAAAPFEIARETEKRALERRLFAWLRARGGLYVQQSGGPEAVHAAGRSWQTVPAGARGTIKSVLEPGAGDDEFWSFMARRGRFYTSAPEWMKEMGQLALMLGTRLHGNMAAIAAGTPGVVIAHDSRTGELAETMHLPAVDMEAVMAASSIGEVLAAVRFDGPAFDAWRRRTAATLADRMAALGIGVSAHLERLAGVAAEPAAS